MSSDFVAVKSEILFRHFCTDLALEQEIMKLKGHSGMVGLRADEAALSRLVTATLYPARIVGSILRAFQKLLKRECHKYLSLN